ncbi:bifunctional 4-hydroxy-2-oxoglutarate aldolase/2-dehydro-3-deoxy-phosphogluconate aldolase [Neiella sp. HB171785]|uniref:Bifunctional 4-hydroxy-2-oxoglutarate aldolase/2-dehydro-3-deoxy-phosphogluconate aldolase n=1 Tax=Neiella litorisoli TaxID=2771431 RepID=A0A8J6QUW6_9GAMM|nr:bifunctional 4-hydroxy-2-oxoglutarate aldolase/2-dehydro-3-deoxy-phosphogluconate aldolase [Neiella litorisoli]MBD1390487.1 bifunctional 4-hydroxy-2-oxoglutarate aldolase/2-dehydro-3-deoxy-phosphogluconate aldolase [Neiella litorisoli]
MNTTLHGKRLATIMNEKLVAIIRVSDPSDIKGIVDCLVTAGIRAIEVTSNTPGYAAELPKLKEQFPQAMFGAGTITNCQVAAEALAAGAEFLVTPNTSKAVVEFAHRQQVPVMMGALTPTDVVTAVEAGADVIKLFPAEPAGIEYFQALAQGPFLDVPFFPVGGIGEHNIADWMSAGATGVGVGGSLFQPVHNDEQRQQLIARCKALLNGLC